MDISSSTGFRTKKTNRAQITTLTIDYGGDGGAGKSHYPLETFIVVILNLIC